MSGSPARDTPPASPPTLEARYDLLQARVRDLGSVAVGFSGGADSALLLKVAVDLLGDRALAVTAVSPSLPDRDRREAIRVARDMGARHVLVSSNEFDDPGYRANAPNRCFFCKKELFDILRDTAAREGLSSIAYGAITDDLGDFRPGMDAAKASGARAPLLEAGFSKEDVRAISRRLGLSTWDRPASACLSSRIPHGVRVEPELLSRVERCEDFLIGRGIRQVRVRAHEEIARIECDPDDIARFLEPEFRKAVHAHFRACGFRFVTLDLQGYRTGSLNPD